ncbi:MAG TPA: efflux RND transporter periplasmic adaptor subunit [Pirellulales bacterium]|nr:efflux RND transporter periplasmic adaptor subunit [Pirellulales bacterium]
MPTLADSLVSSSARPLAIRKRPDLQVTRQRYQGRQYWIVKDPVGLNYFRFQEEEFALLNWLDGKTSLDDLRQRFEKEFAPQKITLEELGRLIGMLHQSALVIAAVPGQGKQLLKLRWERKKREFWGTVSNLLAIRLKGVDPERFFNWLQPKVDWFFSKQAASFCLLLLASALTLVLVQFDTFRAKLPGFHQFFGPSNWIWLGAAMVFTKILHEFGHGLSCKHFGGECHELGVMFLVLTPCLYCNVSDSWMLPNKWHRAFIGAAGMYVEVCIASIATFIWWFSEPGLLNNICLSTMFVCSVSTVVFNGNPLLRYDGYYILSDVLEIPNLRQKATSILNRKLGEWCLGLEQPEDPFLPTRNQFWFMLYTVASSIYTWVVMFSILFFLFRVFQPYRLEIIGQIIAMASIASLIGRPLWSLGKFFYVPGRINEVKKPRFYATLAIVLGVLAAIVFVPFPYHVFCYLTVEPQNADAVYVDVAGEIETVHVQPGDTVQAGAPLADLKSSELELAIADLTGRRNQLEAQMEALRLEEHENRRAADSIPEVQKSLVAIEEQLKKKQTEVDHLHLVAHRAGIVIPPPSVPLHSPSDGKLPNWHGTPLEKQNIGATLKASTLFCKIGDPGKFEAVLVVDQSDIDQVFPGQHVKIMLDEMKGVTFRSEITEISNEPLKVVPKALSNKTGGSIETKPDETGLLRPASVAYEARAPLEDDELNFLTGLKGQAKIDGPWHSLGWRLWRFLQRTFHFKL